jgi:hypothetical protein
MRRHLDSHAGVSTVFHFDHDGDKTIVETTQDVEPILESNKALQTAGDGYNADRDLRRIASIPLVVAQKWMKDDGVNFLALNRREKTAYLRRKLNDPEYAYLRTSPGRF